MMLMVTSVMKYMIRRLLPNATQLFFLASMVLSGCSTTTTVSEEDYDEFYDGGAELVYGNKELPKTAEEMIKLGDSLLAQGKQDEALYQYVKAADQDNKNYTALYKIGDIHSKLGNQVLAIKAYEMALNINPDNGEANEGMALILLNEREYDKARNHLAKAEGSGAAISWRVYNSLGVISDLEKNYKQAIIYYQKALTVQPQMPLILNNMGYSHYMSEDWDSAEKYYRKAVLHDKYFERAWRNLGLLYVRKADYEEAVSAFTQVENLPEAYNDIGFICMLNGEYDISEAFFKRAIKLAPRYYETANNNLQKNRQLASKKSL